METANHWRGRQIQPKAWVNVPWVVLCVAGVLVAIHLCLWRLGPVWQTWSVYALSFIPVRLGGGPVIPRPMGSEIWTFVTYALLHADKYHLLSNCLWLVVFSTPVARRLGAVRYLVLLALTAAAGALSMLIAHWGEFVITVGASAAVAGVMAASIPLMFAQGFGQELVTEDDYALLQSQTIAQLLRSPRAVVFTLVFLFLQVFSGASQMLTGTAFLDERSIAWQAHLGGFFAGFAAFYLLDRSRGSVNGKNMLG